jgi:hypothetical protein
MTHEIDIENYKIIFSKPTIFKYPYYMRRITLDKNIVNNEFIIQTPMLSTFGPKPNSYNNGHYVALYLYSHVVNKQQHIFFEQFNKIINICKDFLHKNASSLGLSINYITNNFSPIFFKNDVPIIYPKIIISDTENIFSSTFYNIKGDEVDPFTSRCDYVKGIIKLEYIILIDNRAHLEFRLI